MADTSDRKPFGEAPDGSTVYRVIIANAGARAAVLTWGASLQEYHIAGVDRSLVLGSATFAPYLSTMKSFGPVVGRVANRIAGGRAPLDGRLLELDRNEIGKTMLHGGQAGSGSCNWQIEGIAPSACTMSLVMPDGAGGFPGTLTVFATYRIDADGAIVFSVSATSDAPTFCNFAQHSYWNLDGNKDLSRHRLTVHADTYLPVDDRKIPVGPPSPVAGTRFDYREPAAVLHSSLSLDHNFCLGVARLEMREAAVLRAADVCLRVATTEPGLQIYDGGHIDTAPDVGHSGRAFGKHAGLAIEPQAWPDAPNHPGYPAIVLRPGETYRQDSRFHAMQVAANDREARR